jgi:hypothetical protein
VEETRVPEENHRPATSHSQIEIVIYKLEALSAQLGLHLSKCYFVRCTLYLFLF